MPDYSFRLTAVLGAIANRRLIPPVAQREAAHQHVATLLLV